VRSVLLLALLIAITITCITLNSAGAQNERVTVRLDGRAMFRLSAVENVDATARALQIERRISRLLENPTAIAPPRIEPTQDSDRRVITIARVPVVTVTKADAQDNLTTVDTLATQWSEAITTARLASQSAPSFPFGTLCGRGFRGQQWGYKACWIRVRAFNPR